MCGVGACRFRQFRLAVSPLFDFVNFANRFKAESTQFVSVCMMVWTGPPVLGTQVFKPSRRPTPSVDPKGNWTQRGPWAWLAQVAQVGKALPGPGPALVSSLLCFWGGILVGMRVIRVCFRAWHLMSSVISNSAFQVLKWLKMKLTWVVLTYHNRSKVCFWALP